MHALLGENGAGKSTLMNVLYGLHQPDEGEIRLRGEPVRIGSPRQAIGLRIGMVHQHFMLIPVMTVAENVVLASEPRKGALLDVDGAERRVRELSQTFGFNVDPRARVEDIGVGQQQRVEILRVLHRGADILILDEPTAVLTAQETAELFKILRTLTREGVSVIFISHKLREVLDIAGFQAGAKKADPSIQTLNAYSQSFTDQAKCKEIALDQIAKGSKVVFQAVSYTHLTLPTN